MFAQKKTFRFHLAGQSMMIFSESKWKFMLFFPIIIIQLPRHGRKPQESNHNFVDVLLVSQPDDDSDDDDDKEPERECETRREKNRKSPIMYVDRIKHRIKEAHARQTGGWGRVDSLLRSQWGFIDLLMRRMRGKSSSSSSRPEKELRSLSRRAVIVPSGPQPRAQTFSLRTRPDPDAKRSSLSYIMVRKRETRSRGGMRGDEASNLSMRDPNLTLLMMPRETQFNTRMKFSFCLPLFVWARLVTDNSEQVQLFVLDYSINFSAA
jgi:hypothetical protein